MFPVPPSRRSHPTSEIALRSRQRRDRLRDAGTGKKPPHGLQPMPGRRHQSGCLQTLVAGQPLHRKCVLGTALSIADVAAPNRRQAWQMKGFDAQVGVLPKDHGTKRPPAWVRGLLLAPQSGRPLLKSLGSWVFLFSKYVFGLSRRYAGNSGDNGQQGFLPLASI